MHRLYVTEGVVLSKRSFGEANSLVAILTSDMGLVRASARSTRVEKSKLRFGLEPLTHARFTFVQGRHEWKLIGVEDISRTLLGSTASNRRAVGRVARLLLRLVHGEEPVDALYVSVYAGLAALAAAPTEDEQEGIECMLVLRTLAHLGYVPSTAALSPFVETTDFPTQLVGQALAARPFLIRTINESLSQSGL